MYYDAAISTHLPHLHIKHPPFVQVITTLINISL